MSKITRATQQVFAGQVLANNNIAQFGSLKAGAAAYSLDPAIIQGLTGYGQGWAGAILANQAPALQDMNALFFLITRQLAYCMQAGVPEWDAGTTYYIGSVASNGTGKIYASLTDANLNNAVTDGTKWVLIGGYPAATAAVAGLLSVGSIPGYIPATTVDKPVTGYAGEYIESMGAGASLTSGQWSDGGASPINLGPGEWDLQATGEILTAFTVYAFTVAIGNATGNSSTGVDDQRNKAQFTLGNTGDIITYPPVLNTPLWRVRVATGTTQNYYPKILGLFGTSASGVCNLFARRVCR